MPKPAIVLIASVDRAGGVGRDGELLVRISADLRRLKALTMGHPIVMGRKTWDSIGRPLPGRRNIVVSRDPQWRAAGAAHAGSWPEALELAGNAASVFVLGGAALWQAALPQASRLELTEVDALHPADTFFPPWPRRDFRETLREPHREPSGLAYDFVTYHRIDGDH